MKLQIVTALLASACVVFANDFPTTEEMDTEFQAVTANTDVDAPVLGSLFASTDLSTAFVWDPTQEEEYHRIVVRQFRPSRRSSYTRKGVRFTLAPVDTTTTTEDDEQAPSEPIELAVVMDKDLLAVQQECTNYKKKNCISNQEYLEALTQDTPADKATAVFSPAGYEVSMMAAVEEQFDRPTRFHRKRRVHTYVLWVKIPQTLAEGSYKVSFDLVRKRRTSSKLRVYDQGGSVDVVVQASALGFDDDATFESLIRGDTDDNEYLNGDESISSPYDGQQQQRDGRGLGYQLGAPVRLAAGGVRNVAGAAGKVFCFVTRTGQKKCIVNDEAEEDSIY